MKMSRFRCTLLLSLLLPVSCFTACSLSPDLADEAPALRDMEEPLELRAEPNDEAERQQLPVGAFSGLYVRDARATLAAKLDEPAEVAVERVVENSPADVAGLQPGDLVLEVGVGAASPQPLRRPSEWRQLELGTAPGTRLVLFVDRAGREARTELVLAERARAAERQPAERYREEQRVGVVLRTATEVEARAAGLGPGGGAVIVGLSANSPWRAAGLRFEDLLVAVDERPIAHPQDLIAALGDTGRERVELVYLRGGVRSTVAAALSQREHELREITLQPLFGYESDRGRSEWSFLFGIFNYRSTAAAWRFRVFWIFGFGGGDADRLLEAGS